MRYKLFGRSGLRVSEVCLGTMTFGEDWGWGASKEESGRIFQCFVGAGGNFIDTSINYTDGTSECFLGDFIAPDRERLVIATKYSLSTAQDDPNAGGNHRKNLMRSLDTSLRRLRTDYVDVLWLHMWDFLTPIDEIMRALDDVIRAGKVLYIGISDTPAWIVSEANTLAELRGWSRFVGLQLPYSLADRSPERDLLPMARAHHMTVTAWAVLGGGVLTGKYNQSGDEAKRYSQASERSRRIAGLVVETAAELGYTPAQVAIAWVRQQDPDTIIPILGARRESQMMENLEALSVRLPDDHLQRLTAATSIDLGFPHTFLVDDEVQTLIFGRTRPLIDAPAR